MNAGGGLRHQQHHKIRVQHLDNFGHEMRVDEEVNFCKLKNRFEN